MSVQYGGDKITFSDGSTVGSGWSGFKNRIINGAMMIDQRNAGAAVTVDGATPYITDRFQVQDFSDAILSAQQVTDAPAGFVNSLKVTVSTADASLGATQGDRVNQRIEGFNIADLGWGTASAQSVTLSFWVKCSLTGTFGGSLQNSASNRAYPFSYTISSANTWEQKTVTIAGDTTGTWLTNNGLGILVNWSLGMGSTYSGTAGAWAASDLISVTGAVNVVGTASATFQLTGVQLEKGSTVTSFDYRPYGTEEALCKRYFQKVDYLHDNGGIGANWYTYNIQLLVQMRSAPTLVAATAYNSDTGNAYMRQSNNFLNGWVAMNASPTAVSIRGSTNEGVSQGVAGRGWFNSEL